MKQVESEKLSFLFLFVPGVKWKMLEEGAMVQLHFRTHRTLRLQRVWWSAAPCCWCVGGAALRYLWCLLCVEND